MKIEYHPWELRCPRCKSPEVNPKTGKLFIRGFKVTDEKGHWSQCLVCSNYYAKPMIIGGSFIETPQNHQPKLGWFVTRH
jgi:hypothetical protein